MSTEPNQKTPDIIKRIQARDLPREVNTLPTAGDRGGGPNYDYAPPTERERLSKLADELDRSKLDEIKWRFRNLNYGEFKEFCEKTGSDIDKIWGWATETA